jgi:dihydroflavonol-4-reductase
MKVLVTGANGFLGSHLVEQLISAGYTVNALVRSEASSSWLQSINCQQFVGDITKFESLIAAFAGVDYVYHCAGLMSEYRSDTKRLFEINVKGTQNILDACLTFKIKKLVHVSSAVTLGAEFFEGKLRDEDDKYNLAHFKVANTDSKKQAQDLVSKYVREKGLNAVIVNPTLIYGARDALKSVRSQNIKAARGKLPFYTLGGVNIVPVSSVVDGMIKACEIGKKGESYILSGKNISFKDLFGIIAMANNKEGPRKSIPNSLLKIIGRIGDVLGLQIISSANLIIPTLFFNYSNEKAVKELGFCPGDPVAAVGESVNWMRDNKLLD